MRILIHCGLLLLLAAVNSSPAYGVTIRECQEMLRVGQYEECLVEATAATERRTYGEDWPILKAEAETRLGRYPEAVETIEAGIARYSWSIRLRMQLHALCPVVGKTERAEELLREINQLATSAPWRYTDADDLVSLGEAAIVLGADPKDVLEGFFDRARRNYETRPDGSLAAGQLASSKGDFALAAEILRPAVRRFDDNPDVLFALANALRSSEPAEATELVKQCLGINPKYAPALQLLAEQHIDAEDYEAAQAMIDMVLETNPAHPEGHALAAVIHHLQGRLEAEQESRQQALQLADTNPAVDHLIGQRLSRKYRFREGAAYQRQALKVAQDYLPAQTQLAQDLLRLGDEAAGWELVQAARRQDAYSTMLFNLMQLKDSLDQFAVRETDRFVIRMSSRELAVYGDDVEAVLNEAFDVLSERYAFVPEQPVTVEIFDQPQDFAVRTFGIPDVAGFLGVCFGKVITANSPASMRRNPSNWRSVLWHEFCHVITLQMTGNRIPRWLSEGISVYEERRRDARWGQSMMPSFRDRILEGNITPVSELSSAFLKAGSGSDINFAYYESSMVVEYIVQEHGFGALLKVLADLDAGLGINDALDRHTGGIEILDDGFHAYLQQMAQDFAPDVTFVVASESEPTSPPDYAELWQNDPKHYSAGLMVAQEHLRAGALDEAEIILKQLIELYPQDASPQSARKILAQVCDQADRREEQMTLLSDHLRYSGSDFDAAVQLLELQVEAEQWDSAVATGRLVLAIDPLQPEPLRDLLRAAQETSQHDLALRVLAGLLELEPSDAPRIRYLMADILRQSDPAVAKRHVLLALEQAPRYREAHRLLQQLTDDARLPVGRPAEVEKAERRNSVEPAAADAEEETGDRNEDEVISDQ